MDKKYTMNLPVKVNKLKNQRCYLSGAMDRVSDGGVGWREKISVYLKARNVVVLDPCKKPINIGFEDSENRENRQKLKQQGHYDHIASDMRVIRNTDLRMVDISDFLIVNLDLDVHPCGTYEELFLANRQMKPIIVRVEQGKEATPDWLLGAIPHDNIFGKWEELTDYLDNINYDNIRPKKRWIFFDL